MNKKFLASLMIGTMILGGISSTVYATEQPLLVSRVKLANTGASFVYDILKSNGYYMEGLSYNVYRSIPEMGGVTRYLVHVYADNILVNGASLTVTVERLGGEFITGTSKEELTKLAGIKWSQPINCSSDDAMYVARADIYSKTYVNVREDQVTSCNLGIFKSEEGYRVCYLVNIFLEEYNSKWKVFVNAINGTIISAVRI